MPTQRLTDLFNKYLSESCTDKELQELSVLLLAKENAGQVDVLLQRAWDKMEINAEMPEETANEILNKIFSHKPKAEIKRIYPWKRWVAAAAVLVAMVSVTHLLTTRKEKHDIAGTQTTSNQDVAAPNKSKATITLSDGSVVSLDDAKAGKVAQQGSVNVTKTADGKIVYSGLTSEIAYNTLSNPRGSLVIDMTLSDGSHVWLNSGSSITYPVSFVDKERKVTMTGEAYFEVAPLIPKGGQGKIPFIVEKGEMKVEVLGTHFNVNAFDDEDEIKVTLLEGSVAVNNSTKKSIIKPGQQARLRPFGSAQGPSTGSGQDIQILNNVDVDQVMAWKNGMFEFSNTELPVIMRQVSRWYDVTVKYEGNPNNSKFGGGLSRNLPLNNVLKLLEANGLKFKTEGKNITVIY